MSLRVTMRNLFIVVASLAVAALTTAMVPPVHDFVLEQVKRSDGLHFGDANTPLNFDGTIIANNTKAGGTCTLNAASPSVCTAAVRSGCRPICTIQGGSAAIAAAGVACAVSSTTLTATSANAGAQVVSYFCF